MSCVRAIYKVIMDNRNNEVNLHEAPLLESGQVCDMLNVSRQTLMNWTNAGKIRRVKLSNKTYRYDETSIYEMLGMHSPRVYKVVIYGRHSRAVRIPGTRIKAQLERVTEWCEGNSMNVDRSYSDISYAHIFDPKSRPGYTELLRDLLSRRIGTIVMESAAVMGIFHYRLFKEICRRVGTRIIYIMPFTASVDMVAEVNAEFKEATEEVKRQSTGV